MPHGSRGPSPRVLYCTDTYPPQVNGVSVVTAESIAGLRVRGWTAGVVTPRYPVPPRVGVREFSDDFGVADFTVHVPSVAFPPYPDIRLAAPLYRRIVYAVREFQPDLVHCATEFMIGRLGQVAARRAGVPIVTSYHTDFSRYSEAYGAPWLRPAVTGYIRRFHGRAWRTFTPSVMARDDLRALGVRNVEVWGRTIDTTTFDPRRRDDVLRRALGVDGRVLLLHVGRLAAEKDVHVLLDAFRVARALLPARSVHLIIAGGGPEERALRNAAPPDVTFLGVLDRHEALPRLYASADAFLFASCTETLGLVVLEAMASGLPVIATPEGGVADHLRDGDNGLAFGAGNVTAMAHAIVRLALDPSLRARLAAGARRTTEHLSWEGELDRLDRSYREVCNEARWSARAAPSARRARSSLAVGR